MRDWKHFPLWELRPYTPTMYGKKDRELLEFTIAEQVSDLLSRHGSLVELDVDLTDCADVDEPKTFQSLQFPEIPLEDDGDLIIEQFPFTPSGICTSSGVHSVTKVNEDGIPEISLTIWDPNINSKDRILDQRNKVVRRDILHELYEALVVIIAYADSEDIGNGLPFNTTHFPIPVIEVDFLQLVSQLE
ncbi:MAG: hypothetical protein U0451_03450 [Candidatus Saccharimonadales bacterium]